MTDLMPMMPRYEAYKYSGVGWIEEIPGHWDIKRLKFLASINNGLDYKAVQADKGYPVMGSGGQFGYANDYLHDGEAILLGRKGTINKPLYINQKFWAVDTIFYAICKQVVSTKFLYYSTMTIPFSYYSTSTALPSMTQSDLYQHYFSVPPCLEQTAIANFLDCKTEKINKAVVIKEKQIQLLKERRQILIQTAVTKGLDPDVPMCDSGVEWIGEIPKHWGMKRLRLIGLTQNGISAGAEYFGSGYPFVSYGDVYNNRELPRSVKGLAESSIQDRMHYSVMKGDVLFTRTSETVEDIGFTSVCMKTIKNATFAGFLIRFRPTSGLLEPRFSKYYFSSYMHRAYFVREMNLVTRASLSQGLLKNLPVLLPPKDEQIAIYNYIQTQSAKIDKAIAIQEQMIDKLKEYKATLINSSVTGKIKVPQVGEKRAVA